MVFYEATTDLIGDARCWIVITCVLVDLNSTCMILVFENQLDDLMRIVVSSDRSDPGDSVNIVFELLLRLPLTTGRVVGVHPPSHAVAGLDVSEDNSVTLVTGDAEVVHVDLRSSVDRFYRQKFSRQ